MEWKFYVYNENILYELNNGNAIIGENIDTIKIFIGENLNENILKENLKGKEYDYNGRLLFEGEFLKKERWKGKFKEYYKDELIFEGEYLDGKIWNGKGKEYNDDGYVTFEGEHKDGKRNGKVKDYYHNELIFDGNYLNDKRNGK